MEIELGEKLSHYLGLSLEKREHTTDKALVEVADSWPSYGDGSACERQPPRLAIAITVPGFCIDSLSPG